LTNAILMSTLRVKLAIMPMADGFASIP